MCEKSLVSLVLVLFLLAIFLLPRFLLDTRKFHTQVGVGIKFIIN